MKDIKKIVIIPDSFKSTMSSIEVSEIIKSSAESICENIDCICVPIADGGEGTVECFSHSINAKKLTVSVNGPFFESVDATYLFDEKTKTAVIEAASCAGITLAEGRLDPEKTTTFGLGEIIKDADKNDAKKIVVGLGGSCTNDGGCGMASALGIRFFDENKTEFIPTGETLSLIKSIDFDSLSSEINKIEIIAMCDVKNPFHGENGAAHIFAKQKGADDAMIKRLDGGLLHLAKIIEDSKSINLQEIEGTGAAGGLGGGMIAFLNAKLNSGIETMLDMVNFDEIIKGADLIITGEGNFDSQSLDGKVIDGISSRAKKQNIPVIVVCGGVSDNEIQKAYSQGVSAVFPITRQAKDFSITRNFSKEYLKATADNIFRLMNI